MANFQPSGIIHIGNVPFNNSYKDVRIFKNVLEQEGWILSHMDYDISMSNYTYVRMNNAIRIQGNAENLYNYNYCMYKNTNYGNKWFYAFITSVQYINENTTQFNLELDVMQTWMFDYALKPTFIEREHSNTDEIGSNLQPEPDFAFNKVIADMYVDTDFSDISKYDLIIQANEHPTSRYTSEYATTGKINNLYQAADFYCFDNNDMNNGVFEQQIKWWFTAQSGGSIVAAFLFPKAYEPPKRSGGVSESAKRRFNYNTAPVKVTHNIQMPNTLDGYVPKNNKLFTYPYCYPQFFDAAGHVMELKYELWNKSQSNTYQFTTSCPLDADTKIIVRPIGYDGYDGESYAYAFKADISNRIAYPMDNFAAWNAAHLSSMLIATGSIAMSVSSAGTSLAAAHTAQNFAQRAARRYSGSTSLAQIGRENTAARSRTNVELAEQNIHTTNLQGAQQAATMGINSINPTTSSPGSSGMQEFAIGMRGYFINKIVPQYEFAKLIDRYFDMYGYACNDVKIPNLFTRKSWNYIKMQNSSQYGNIPANDMEIINSVYNAGVTFWHIDDVGNYDADNSIVI